MSGDFPAARAGTRTSTRSTSATTSFDLTGQEVHADGEIWIAVQYDVRELFLEPLPGARNRRSTVECASRRVAGRRSARATAAGSSSTTTRWC